MSDLEKVDVVDKNDKLTGQTITMGEAHTSVIPHRISAVLVFRSSGKLLVQVHAWHNRRLDHSVGGHVSAGEDYDTAAKREMEEELGLVIPLSKVAEGVWSDEYYPKDNKRVVHVFGVFVAEVPNDWRFKETEEVDMIVEMTVEEIVAMMNESPDKFLQGFMTSLGAYLRHIGSELKINAYGKNWGKL